ncbi:MAG: hypothetical protein NPIRA02_21460 [Nitrospirales bacterium]|nr:MAG: hypothetical protein NPIRA02_21460 [Nitrospirales bacterium]
MAGLLAWTLSLHIVPVQLDAQQKTIGQCHTPTINQQIFQSMTEGIVTHMWNNGIILSITVSEDWNSLSPHSQEHLYRALGCLAHGKRVAFQIIPSWIRALGGPVPHATSPGSTTNIYQANQL